MCMRCRGRASAMLGFALLAYVTQREENPPKEHVDDQGFKDTTAAQRWLGDTLKEASRFAQFPKAFEGYLAARIAGATSEELALARKFTMYGSMILAETIAPMMEELERRSKGDDATAKTAVEEFQSDSADSYKNDPTVREFFDGENQFNEVLSALRKSGIAVEVLRRPGEGFRRPMGARPDGGPH